MKNILSLIITALILAGCSESRWMREFELDDNSFDSEAMQMIKTDMGMTLPLPAGARGLNFRYSPPIDPSYVARIEILKESSDSVRKQIEAIKNEDINISGGPGEKVDWWPAPKESTIISRQCWQADGDYFSITLTKEGNQNVLYVRHAVF